MHSVAAPTLVSTDSEGAYTFVAHLAVFAATANASASVLAAILSVALGLTCHAITVDAFVKSSATSAASSATVVATGLSIACRLATLELVAHLIGPTAAAICAAKLAAFETFIGAVRLRRTELTIHSAFFLARGCAEEIPVVRAARGVLFAHTRLALAPSASGSLLSIATIRIGKAYV